MGKKRERERDTEPKAQRPDKMERDVSEDDDDDVSEPFPHSYVSVRCLHRPRHGR